MYKIFPSTVHTFRKPYSSLAALNLRIHNFVQALSIGKILTFQLLLVIEDFASFRIPRKLPNYGSTFIFCFGPIR